MTENPSGPTELMRTPLYDLHVEQGARMVPFAGHAMPVQYPGGIITEHRHTRAAAGLFDVSHMGQAFLDAAPGEDAGALLEELTPGDIRGLKPGRQRYTMLLNDNGGIIDDLMVARSSTQSDRLFLVVNAGTKDGDFRLIEEKLEGRARLTRLEDRALIALQGPEAAVVLARFVPGIDDIAFMDSTVANLDERECFISRSGYTGEDGYEISVPASGAEALARRLLEQAEVAPIGLGARDTLRLEAGLCLYGHDIDESTSPVEAGLTFAIARRRREAGDFPGAARILRELEDGPARHRVGLRLEGRGLAREGAEIVNAQDAVIGVVTSGGFGPSVDGAIATGYVTVDNAAEGTPVGLRVRGRSLAARVAAMPFVPHRYYRKPS